MFFASYGSFMHSLLEGFYAGRIDRKDLLPAYLTGFRDHVKGQTPSQKVFASYFQDGVSLFQDFHPLPWKTIKPELRIGFEIDGTMFIGILDHVGKNENGLIITDHKSRKLSPRSNRKKPTKNGQLIDAYLRQLYRYSIPIRQAFGEYPAELCLDCFRDGTLIREPFREDVFEQVMEETHREIETIAETERFKPKLEFFKCRYLCEMHEHCDYYRVNYSERS